MNEEILAPTTEADIATATPLTDDEIAKLLATGSALTYYAEADEVAKDEATIH